MITEDKVTEIFCIADDFCKFFDAMMARYTLKPVNKRKYHRDSTMSKAEIMLIMILFHDSGYRCLKHFYLEKVCRHLRHLFPDVVSYNRFVELEREVAIPLALFIKKVLLGKCTGISFVDSTPLRVCRNQRIHIHKVFKGIAQRGKCSMGWFFGFKLHLMCNEKGELLNFMITPGDVDDRRPLEYKAFVEFIYGKLVGEPLFGKDGALAPMLERILNAALEGEMDAHLSSEERSSGNRRNGKMPKQVQTKYGEVTVETPRDRECTFDPQTVKKRETILAEGMADQIIGMYAFGTSTREISRYFEKEFDTKLSAETLSAITDRVLPEIKEWKSRTLEPVYAICWLDAIHYKVKDDSGRAVTRAIYNVLGVSKNGQKELLGMYVAKSEGANF